MSKPQTEHPFGRDTTFEGTCIHICIILQGKKESRVDLILFIYTKTAYTNYTESPDSQYDYQMLAKSRCIINLSFWKLSQNNKAMYPAWRRS